MLVLILTLSLAGVALSAVFLASSSSLLGRFHDRDRDFRLAAEAGIELARARIVGDTGLAIPDTGVLVLHDDIEVDQATGGTVPRVRLSVFVGYTGDTVGTWGRYVTALAVARDSAGHQVRAARRLDLLPENFGRYSTFVRDWGTSVTLQPQDFQRGRLRTNSGLQVSTGTTFYDSVHTVTAPTGTGTYSGGRTVVTAVPFPDSSWFLATRFHGGLPARATAGNLAITPVSGTVGGATRGTRLEYLALDLDDSGVVDSTETVLRVFDLASGQDTTRLKGQVPWVGITATAVSTASDTNALGVDTLDVVLQRQCGAYYRIGGRLEFFTVAAHRLGWVRDRIQASTSPVVSAALAQRMSQDTTGTRMRTAINLVLNQGRARCFPAGAPQLATSERLTDAAGVITGTAADVVPWGVANPAHRYGGLDTTFTPLARTCRITLRTSAAPNRCEPGTVADLGSWRTFPGAATTVAGAVRQAAEVPYLWPVHPSRNPGSRYVVHVNGRAHLSGTVRGRVTTYVSGSAEVIDNLVYDRPPSDSVPICRDLHGLIVRDSVIVAQSTMNYPMPVRYAADPNDPTSYRKDWQTRFLGGDRDIHLHAWVATLHGTLAPENAQYTEFPWYYPTCPRSSAGDHATLDGMVRSAGCLMHVGPQLSRTYALGYSPTVEGSGYRESREVDPCQRTSQRPPWFPQLRRFVVLGQVEVSPILVDTEAEVRTWFDALRGRPVP